MTEVRVVTEVRAGIEVRASITGIIWEVMKILQLMLLAMAEMELWET